MTVTTEPMVYEGVYHRQLREMDNQPVAVVWPEAYEPRYPYPLVVFLHGSGESETQGVDAFPAMSRRNYIGLSLRGPSSVVRANGAIGHGWGGHRRCDAAIEDYVLTAIQETMRLGHVHSERIFLIGHDEGASIAYRLGLSFPEKFAGVAALNGWLPAGPLPPCHLRSRRALRVFIGHHANGSDVPVQRAEEASRVLYSAGLSVQKRLYDGNPGLVDAMLRDVNRWIISCCELVA